MTTFTTETREPIRKLTQRIRERIPGVRKQRVGRRSGETGWRVYLLHPKTGQVGPMLDPESGSWSIQLNGIEELSCKVRKADLAGVERKWYTPGWGGLLLTWTQNGEEHPFIAGPITTWGEETDTELPLQAAGIRHLFTRQIIDRDLRLTSRPLGLIAWNVVQHSASKYGGMPPIFNATPDPRPDSHERTYEAWNIQNNGIDKRLTELSNVINGPDMMFRPQWARDRKDERDFIEWGFHHGTASTPLLVPTAYPDFDTTPARSAVSSLRVVSDTGTLISRMWGSGAGEGPGTVIVSARNNALVDAGFLFFEDVMSQSDEDRQHLLERDVQGHLHDRVDAVDQITVGVMADDPKLGIHAWKVGDPARVTIKGYLSVPDGSHDTIIYKASGDLGYTVTVDFQTETLI